MHSLSKNIFSLRSLLHLGDVSFFPTVLNILSIWDLSKGSETVVSDFGTYLGASRGCCQKALELPLMQTRVT